MAQYLFLYTKTYRFLQTISQHKSANQFSGNGLRKTSPSEKSAKLCKSLQFLQTFLVRLFHSFSFDPGILLILFVKHSHFLFLRKPSTIHHQPSTISPLSLSPLRFLLSATTQNEKRTTTKRAFGPIRGQSCPSCRQAQPLPGQSRQKIFLSPLV